MPTHEECRQGIHTCDNQGLCHWCGKLLNADWWFAYAGECHPDAPRHAGCKCARCEEVIEDDSDGESTPLGSMHADCAHRYEQEQPEDW